MTYVSEQTSDELRSHMRSLTEVHGWYEPLSALWKEIQSLDKAKDAAQRAYGILWRECTTSLYAKAARKELFDSLSHEERRVGIAWAMDIFGPMTDAEMIAADIRVGAFPNKSTETSQGM